MKYEQIRVPFRNEPPAEHWLDYSLIKYDRALVVAVKSLVAVLALFTPVVFFWALFDQQGSTWVLQVE